MEQTPPGTADPEAAQNPFKLSWATRLKSAKIQYPQFSGV